MKYPNVPPSDSLIVWISSMGSLASSACTSCWTRGGRQFRRHRGTNLQGTLRSEVLGERDIKVRLRVFSENAVFAVARNTYDLDEWADIADQTKAFAYWVFSRPKMPSHRLVDNRYERNCFTVSVCESAAEDHTNAECVEIGWVDVVEESSGCSFEATLRNGITMLINNAGTASVASLLNADVNKMDEIIALNITALTRLTYAAAPAFVARGNGTIINIGSVVGVSPEALNGVYGASKAYVLAFRHSLQNELADKGIRVQAVLPGATATDLWEIAGLPWQKLPPSIVMPVEDMVDAALVGLDQGELVTIPGLHDGDEWTRFEAACRAISQRFGNSVPARRYRIGEPAQQRV